MTRKNSSRELPSDSHLQEDISVPSEDTPETRADFAPGQTNAGQQVAGLASPATDPMDKESGPDADSNNPV
jgi:hypothetical protein